MPFALHLLALAVFAMGTSEFMLAGLVPDIATSLDVSVGSAGLLTSAFAVGMIVGSPLMAAFARRWPARTTLLGFVVIFTLCHVVAATTPSFSVLFATRVLAAVANAGFLAVALTTATGLVAPNQKGRALAALLSGTTIAVVAGVPAGALLGTAMGWRATFWAVALLCVPAAVGILAGIRPRSEPTAEGPAAGASRPSNSRNSESPDCSWQCCSERLSTAGPSRRSPFLHPSSPRPQDWTRCGYRWPWSCSASDRSIGVTAAGRLSDRRPRPILGVAAPLLFLGWLALALVATHPVLLLILVFVQGILAFAVGSTLIARVLYAASEAPTMGGSYATAALNTGAAAGPAIAALTLSDSSDLGPVWVASLLTGLALLMLLPSVGLIAPRNRSAEVVR